MNPFDLAIIACLAIFFLRGLSRGLVREVLGLIGVIIAFLVAVRWVSEGALFLRRLLEIPSPVASLVSFFLIFISVLLGLKLIALMIQRLMEISLLGWLDRLGGGVFGLLKGGILVSIFALVISFLPLSKSIMIKEEESYLFDPARRFAPAVFDTIVRLSPKAKSFYSELKEGLPDLKSLDQKAKELINSLDKTIKKGKGLVSEDNKGR